MIFYNRLLYVVSFLAPLVLFLPVHPVLQGFTYQKIPSLYISLAFFVVTIFVFSLILPVFKIRINPNVVFLMIAVLLYVLILFSNAMQNYTYHLESYTSSLFSLLITLPLSIFIAYLSSIRPKAAYWSLLFLALIVVLTTLYVFLNKEVHSSGFVGASVIGDHVNYQVTSIYVGMFFILFTRLIKNKYFIFFNHTSALFILSVVGTRSSLVAYLFTISFLYLFRSEKKFRNLLYLVVFIILIFSFLLLDINKPVIFYRIAVLFDGTDSSSRLFLFTSALEMWTESLSNFVFGGGLGSFPIFIGSSGLGWYPHNFIFETLAEGGLFAFLFLLYVLVYYVNTLGEAFKNKSVNVFALLSVYFVVIYQFIGGINTIWMPLFFVFLHIFIKIKEEGHNEC